MTDHLLTPHDDLQKTLLDNVDFSWFTDSSHWKDENGRYCARYEISTPFEVTEAAPLPLAVSAKQAKPYTLTGACILAKGKTFKVYSNSRYNFGVAHDFGMLWRQHGFLTSSRDQI